MKAKKIDLSQYASNVVDPSTEGGFAMFDIRTSLVNVLFHQKLNLGAVEVLERDELRRAIINEETDTLLVSPDDWQKLCGGVKAVDGFGQNDVEFIRRVLKADEVEVDEHEPPEA